MYVALRQLKISVPGEDGRTRVLNINPGQPVPGVETWSYPNIIAHLNMKMMEWKGDEIEAPHNAHKNSGVVVSMEARRLFQKMAPKKEYNAVVPTAPKQDTQPEQATTIEEPVDTTTPAPQFQCAKCDTSFKNKSALSSHNRAKHSEAKRTKAG